MYTHIAKQQSVMGKAPPQIPSSATVETIVQAGARILSDEVREVHDEQDRVSIGSLYQYFHDKLS